MSDAPLESDVAVEIIMAVGLGVIDDLTARAAARRIIAVVRRRVEAVPVKIDRADGKTIERDVVVFRDDVLALLGGDAP